MRVTLPISTDYAPGEDRGAVFVLGVTAQDVADFDAYMQAFHAALDLERRAAEGE